MVESGLAYDIARITEYIDHIRKGYPANMGQYLSVIWRRRILTIFLIRYRVAYQGYLQP